jgi:GT2 family glycosyltransferase
VSSYGAPEKLNLCLQEIAGHSRTDWRVFVVHNPSEDDWRTRDVINEWAAREPSRIIPVWMPENVGYAGAVNKLFEVAETEYIAYLDRDAYVGCSGWDETLCTVLDRYHEVGMVFPNGGAYELERDGYTEVMWAPGFAFVISRLAMKDTGAFDTSLGHQDEADYCLRLRMAGYKCAAVRNVKVKHDATATNDPAAIERINRGVVAWMNKWTAYFGGKNLNYHSQNVLRWDDWPPNALYLEEWWKVKLPGLNAAPETVEVDGREYDLLRVPRYAGFYTNRII